MDGGDAVAVPVVTPGGAVPDGVPGPGAGDGVVGVGELPDFKQASSLLGWMVTA